jgi:hypothetical protein
MPPLCRDVRASGRGVRGCDGRAAERQQGVPDTDLGQRVQRHDMLLTQAVLHRMPLDSRPHAACSC